MSDQRAEILTGAAVLAVALGFAAFAGLGSGLTGPSGSYDLHASFRSLEGITIGTDVRLAGVKVGSVTAMELDPQTFFADATLSLRDDLLLPEDSAALVSSEGLLGGAFVELVPGGSPVNIEAGGEIEDTQGAVSIFTLLMRFAGGGEDSADAAP
ncbi:outer membrane lipid asymmetry maintenance protein MlaD [Frigidibacter oleivorans]|uniref:outer membrane lipid asymmetry maintenance protein MlaD n=1 Tax=Frigidibacter oleivorans TaxID=2487129 RepID=UPI000F8F5998|nr:outer membrane lipid asymmetry maintenance protein MlaD [Frigidibacter oleivorans]